MENAVQLKKLIFTKLKRQTEKRHISLKHANIGYSKTKQFEYKNLQKKVAEKKKK